MLAFPSIGTGAYGFPIERASRIAIEEVIKGLSQNPVLETVGLVCFGNTAKEIYARALLERISEPL